MRKRCNYKRIRGSYVGSYRVAICEDEIFYQDELISAFTSYQEESEHILELELYQKGEEFLEVFNQKTYHIVILDVEMGTLSGIDVAKEIRNHDGQVQIIFATSHEQYALNAFDVSALGYLVKPVSYIKLKEILSKAIMMVDFIQEKMELKERYIQITVNYRLVNIRVDTITYIEKKRNLSIIHIKNNRYSCYETLSQLHERLDIYLFVYTHQGFIVNFNKIKEVLSTNIIMEGNIKIPLSRKYQKTVKERFIAGIYNDISEI